MLYLPKEKDVWVSGRDNSLFMLILYCGGYKWAFSFLLLSYWFQFLGMLCYVIGLLINNQLPCFWLTIQEEDHHIRLQASFYVDFHPTVKSNNCKFRHFCLNAELNELICQYSPAGSALVAYWDLMSALYLLKVKKIQAKDFNKAFLTFPNAYRSWLEVESLLKKEMLYALRVTLLIWVKRSKENKNSMRKQHRI